MYERVKDQQAWQLEQGQELSALKEKVDATQETGVTNHILDNQTALGLATLDGHVEVLDTGGEGLWKRVFTCWEHFRLCHKVLPMFRPDTFHSHFIHISNVTSTFACNVITSSISVTFEM